MAMQCWMHFPGGSGKFPTPAPACASFSAKRRPTSPSPAATQRSLRLLRYAPRSPAQTSLAQFVELYEQSIDHSERAVLPAKRIANIIEHLT